MLELMTTGEEHRHDTGEVALYVSGHQPSFILLLRLRRRRWRWERQGYRVVRDFRGGAAELVDHGVVRAYDAGDPDAPTVGAVLVRTDA